MLSLPHCLACDLQISCKTLSSFFFFLCCFSILLQKKHLPKKTKQNKTLSLCLPLNPAEGLNLKSLLEFVNFMLIFCRQMANFLAVPLNRIQEKINPEVHSFKFASFLLPIVSHLDSCHFSCPYIDLLKEALQLPAADS